jgi:fatty acid desaturase
MIFFGYIVLGNCCQVIIYPSVFCTLINYQNSLKSIHATMEKNEMKQRIKVWAVVVVGFAIGVLFVTGVWSYLTEKSFLQSLPLGFALTLVCLGLTIIVMGFHELLHRRQLQRITNDVMKELGKDAFMMESEEQ